MNNYFHENKKNAHILLGLFFLLLIVMFFLFLQPLSKELKSTTNLINQTEDDIALLKVQLENADGDTLQSDDLDRLRYANQLPMTPETEEIILMLEEIEFISGSRINDVIFSYDGSLPEQSTTEEDKEVEQEGTEDVSQDPLIILEEKPEDLQIITLDLSVSSPDYEQFQNFLKEIEKQERMMMVSSMSFQNPAERELLIENPNETINANLTISTFYYEN